WWTLLWVEMSLSNTTNLSLASTEAMANPGQAPLTAIPIVISDTTEYSIATTEYLESTTDEAIVQCFATKGLTSLLQL
ncbi:hypothetical protein HDU84_009257, partial [Entophlyctis sp. JEL0112]